MELQAFWFVLSKFSCVGQLIELLYWVIGVGISWNQTVEAPHSRVCRWEDRKIRRHNTSHRLQKQCAYLAKGNFNFIPSTPNFPNLKRHILLFPSAFFPQSKRLRQDSKKLKRGISVCAGRKYVLKRRRVPPTGLSKWVERWAWPIRRRVHQAGNTRCVDGCQEDGGGHREALEGGGKAEDASS